MTEEEKWKEVGYLSKSIRKDLFKLMHLSQKVGMRKKEVNSVIGTIKSLDNYRSKAEDYMFSQGCQNLDIFYGGDEEWEKQIFKT